MIDNLSYTYAGTTSLLSSVSDASNNLRGFKGAASSYGYDPTGNMISDSQKGITDIAYTYNDLPIKITSANGTIENFYTSAGEKLKSIITPTNQELNAGPVTRIYLGGAEYVDGKLETVYTDEGRVVISKDGNYPEYYLKDHLGNTRVRIADKNLDNLVFIDPNDPENDELMSTHHYYPFGMEWDTPALDVSGNDLGETGVDSRYTYNGKEFVDDLGINLHDYGARYYDPAIARWTSIDPMAEVYSPFSAYNYTLNNPIKFIDPNGMYVSSNATYNNLSSQFETADKENKRKQIASTANNALSELNNQNEIKAIHFVFESLTKTIYRNTVSDITIGNKPNTLTYNGGGVNNEINRDAIGVRDWPSFPGFQKDEYPYASTYEGGENANVHYVPSKENSYQGGQLSIIYNFMQDGDKFLVMPVSKNGERSTVIAALASSALALSQTSTTQTQRASITVIKSIKHLKNVGKSTSKKAAGPFWFPIYTGPGGFHK